MALYGGRYMNEEGKQFRTKLKEEWEMIADILQDHRLFNGDVQILHNSIGRITREECMEFMEDMETLSASLAQRNETMYGGGKFRSSPYERFFVEIQNPLYGPEPDVEECEPLFDNAVYNDGLTARSQFSSASKGIRAVMIQFRNFWNEQNTFIKKSLVNLKEGDIDIAYQEAKQYAEQWSVYDKVTLSAIEEIIRVCDAVTIEPTSGILFTEANQATEDSTADETNTFNIDFAPLGRAMKAVAPLVACYFFLNASPARPEGSDPQTAVQRPTGNSCIQEGPNMPIPVQNTLASQQPRLVPAIKGSRGENSVRSRQNYRTRFTPDRPLRRTSPRSPSSAFNNFE
ncbi:hypothetical protein FRC15_003025 [Serendipita sp. 397]|nr:hypothetical protein FRC15_003025 [Serendipita sp. 397]